MTTTSEITIPSSIIELVQPTTVPEAASAMPSQASRFLDPYYYLDPVPFSNPYLLGRPLLVLFLLMAIAAFALLIRSLYPRLKRRSEYTRIAAWLLSFAAAGTMLLYFRRDRVPYLGMRLWMALLLIGILAWAVSEFFRWRKARA